MEPARDVEAYVRSAPKEVRPKLIKMRAVIKEVAPDSNETISYGMPFYSFKGEAGVHARLCYFGFRKNDIVFYTRPAFLEGRMHEARRYVRTKSALHFPLDKPIPTGLIKNLVADAVRLHEAGKV